MIAHPTVAELIVSQLSKIYKTWKSTYALQETYRIFEVYLGFKTFVSIVPHIPSSAPYSFGGGSQDKAQALAIMHSFSDRDMPASDLGFAKGSLSTWTSNSSPTPVSTLASSPSPSFPATISSSENVRQPRRTFCVECNREFKRVCNYNKHRRDKHEIVKYECRVEGCGKEFSRNQYRKAHEGKEH